MTAAAVARNGDSKPLEDRKLRERFGAEREDIW
jgi:hypothetical protein